MTQTPETQPETQTAATDSDSVNQRRWLKSAGQIARQALVRPKRAYNTVYTFMNELSRDHTFWIHMMAVRSGATMTVLSAASVVAYAMTLPFALAATVITGVAVLAGGATVGLIAGTRFILGRMRAAYDSMKNGTTADPSVPAPPVPAASDRPFYRTVDKLAQWKVFKAIGTTKAWQQGEKFVREQKKWMLGGTALSGAALTTGMSAWVLVAQVAVAPVIVIGSAVSFVALFAVAGVISGGAGLYFGSKSLLRWHRVSRAEKASCDMVTNKNAASDEARGSAPLAQLGAKADFGTAAAAATQDTAQEPKALPPANDDAAAPKAKTAQPKKK